MQATAPRTPHQLLAARIAESSLPAVAAEIGISDRDLRDFMVGIALAAMPAERLRAWCEPHLPARQPDAITVPRPSRAAEHDRRRERDHAPAPRDRPRRDSGWAFVRSAYGDDLGLPVPRPRERTRRSQPATSTTSTTSNTSTAPGSQPAVDVEKIRAFVRQRVDETSAREVLAEIGPPLRHERSTSS